MPPTGASWIVAALASSSVVCTAQPVTPTVKLVAVTARGEKEPRPGRLDAAEARGRPPGRPSCRPGAQIAEIEVAMQSPQPNKSRIAGILERLTRLLVAAGSLTTASTSIIGPLQTLAAWLGHLGVPLLGLLPG